MHVRYLFPTRALEICPPIWLYAEWLSDGTVGQEQSLEAWQSDLRPGVVIGMYASQEAAAEAAGRSPNVDAEVSGHVYLLQPLDPGPPQPLFFVRKEERDGAFVTVQNGTTNEEVVRVLLDRMRFLQAKAPCIENEMAILSLESCSAWLAERSRNRQVRGVEGTPAP